jgi:hypothetical protein
VSHDELLIDSARNDPGKGRAIAAMPIPEEV